MKRSTFLAWLGASAAGLCSGAASAQSTYPNRPVRLIVPYPAGGNADGTGRVVAERLGVLLGQPMVVDNRPGAAAAIGTAAVARSEPDGYTVGLGTSSTHVFVPLVGKVPYHPENDFEPVAYFADLPFVLVAHPSLPVSNVRELVAYAKANPGKLFASSDGTGSTTHLALEYFNKRAGTQITHVPYKGTGTAMTDLLAGTVQLSFQGMLAAAPHAKQGKLKMLAVSAISRMPSEPEVPTMAEAGFQGFQLGSWYGLWLPKGAPAEVVQKLHAAVMKMTEMDEVKKRFTNDGLLINVGGPQELRRRMSADKAMYTELLSSANIKLD